MVSLAQWGERERSISPLMAYGLSNSELFLLRIDLPASTSQRIDRDATIYIVKRVRGGCR